ncbi:MAG: hypothetical protein ACRDHP_04095 [Ktedonobacterales bacterium]
MREQHPFASELAHEQEAAGDAQHAVLDQPPTLEDEQPADAKQHPIEGKVAEIISEMELAINVGAKDGYENGMLFSLLSATPIVIRDPDTNEVLTELDRSKIKVKVTEVGESYALCTTYRTRWVGGSLLQDILAVGSPSRRVRETLRADESSRSQPLSPEESYVKIGDRVLEVTE